MITDEKLANKEIQKYSLASSGYFGWRIIKNLTYSKSHTSVI